MVTQRQPSCTKGFPPPQLEPWTDVYITTMQGSLNYTAVDPSTPLPIQVSVRSDSVCRTQPPRSQFIAIQARPIRSDCCCEMLLSAPAQQLHSICFRCDMDSVSIHVDLKYDIQYNQALNRFTLCTGSDLSDINMKHYPSLWHLPVKAVL